MSEEKGMALGNLAITATLIKKLIEKGVLSKAELTAALDEAQRQVAHQGLALNPEGVAASGMFDVLLLSLADPAPKSTSPKPG